MNLILVSADPELRVMCAEALSNLSQPCNLIVTSKDHAPVTGDFYIWDAERGSPIPAPPTCDPAWKHLFLIHPNDRSVFQQHGWFAEAVVLLKPVTRVTLRAFLEHAFAAHARQDSESDRSRRASCDDLLQCLIETNLRLQDYDQERTNFLARAVHDFRAPLTAINGYCGLLIAEPLGTLNEEQKEVLRRMQRSAKRLARMTSAMFQLSVRGRAKSNAPDLSPGDVRDCMQQALHEITPSIDKKHIKLSVEMDTPRGSMLIDKTQVEEVLLNLLDNACKFTPEGAAISVKGYSYFWDRRNGIAPLGKTADRRQANTRIPNSFRLDIQDSGPGIPAEHLESIFEEYTRYSENQDRSGGGLGLAICKMLTQAHRGRIWAESNHSGATFSLVLPFASHHTGEEIHKVRYAVA